MPEGGGCALDRREFEGDAARPRSHERQSGLRSADCRYLENALRAGSR